jgi:uncharacterized protein (TIGR03435 family)
MRNRAGEAPRNWRALFLATAGMAALAVPTFLGLITVPRLRAQSGTSQAPATSSAQSPDTPLPSFEVASIKVHPADNTGRFFVNIGCGPDPGRCTPTNATAKMLIQAAYNMKDFQVSGGPGWINSERFDIEAKVEDSLAEQLQKLPREQRQAQKSLMLQSLLADRFKLKVTHETKELPVFALVVSKGGPKLTELPPPDPEANPAPAPLPASPGAGPPEPGPGGFFIWIANGQAGIKGNATPIANLVKMLSLQLKHQILDQTGLKDTYTFTLQFTPEVGLGGGPLPVPGADPSDADATSIFTAIQQQLGLRLESSKGPVDTIVIDHIEEPSPN